MAAWSVRAPYITALKHSQPFESMISLSATASIYTLPNIHLPTWRPRNSFQWSSVTGQSNNSSSRIPLDCHNLGDLCCILVVFVFYHLPLNIKVTACFELNRKLHLMISDIKSVINIYTLVRKLSESWYFLWNL